MFHSNIIGSIAEKTSVAAGTKVVVMVFPRTAEEEKQDPEPELLSQYQLMGLHWIRRNMTPCNPTQVIANMATYILYL